MSRAYEEVYSNPLGYVQNVICTTPATPSVGDIVIVGDLVGFALQDEDADGYTVVDFGPKTLKGSVTASGGNVASGTPLYASVSEGVITISNVATGKFVGYALGAVTSGQSGTIEFLKEPSITASTTLGDGTVTEAELADGAVTADKIGADAVDGTKIADDAIDSEHIADGAIDNAHMADDSVDSAQIVDGAVDKNHLAGGFLKCTMVAGGAAGDFTVAGIATGDELVSVWHVSTAAAVATIADITSEFDITAANTINNTGGTATTDDQLIVFWLDLTA